jgi:hypothetical protein
MSVFKPVCLGEGTQADQHARGVIMRKSLDGVSAQIRTSLVDAMLNNSETQFAILEYMQANNVSADPKLTLAAQEKLRIEIHQEKMQLNDELKKQKNVLAAAENDDEDLEEALEANDEEAQTEFFFINPFAIPRQIFHSVTTTVQKVNHVHQQNVRNAATTIQKIHQVNQKIVGGAIRFTAAVVRGVTKLFFTVAAKLLYAVCVNLLKLFGIQQVRDEVNSKIKEADINEFVAYLAGKVNAFYINFQDLCLESNGNIDDAIRGIERKMVADATPQAVHLLNKILKSYSAKANEDIKKDVGKRLEVVVLQPVLMSFLQIYKDKKLKCACDAMVAYARKAYPYFPQQTAAMEKLFANSCADQCPKK